MKSLITLILLATSVSCFAQQKIKLDAVRSPKAKINTQQLLKTDSVYISGKIDNYDAFKEKANSIQVIVDDLPTGQQLTYRAKIKSDGTYRLPFLKTSAQDVLLQFNGQNQYIVVNPGDKMQVDFAADKFLGGLTFKGQGAVFNQKYKAYNEARYTEAALGYGGGRIARRKAQTEAEKANEPAAYKKVLTDRFNQEGAFLAEYVKQHKVSPMFVKWAKADLRYGYFNDLMMYTLYYPMYHPSDPKSLKITEDYYDFVKPEDLNNLDAAMTMSYGGFLPLYASHLTQKKLGQSYPVVKQVELLLAQPEGLERDAMLAYALANLIRIGGVNEVTPYMARFKVAQAQPGFKNRVVKDYNEAIEKQNALAKPVTAAGIRPKTEADSIFYSIIDQYKGKVIYVDFWSTWCAPCVAEMPSSKKLHDQFAGKDVVFLYLGLQCDEKDWKAVVDKINVGGEHRLLSNNEYAALAVRFKVSAIPRHMLVDKFGRVYKETAQFPGYTDEAKKDIEKLLADK